MSAGNRDVMKHGRRATVHVGLALDILTARLPPIRHDDLTGLLFLACGTISKRRRTASVRFYVHGLRKC